MGPKNTPISKICSVIDRKIYSLNQNVEVITFDTTQLLCHADKTDFNVLSKAKFVVDSHCTEALKNYYTSNKQLKKDLFEHVLMSIFEEYIIVIGNDNKALFINVKNANVQCIDFTLKLNDFATIYDIGVVNGKLLYILGIEDGDNKINSDGDIIHIFELSKEKNGINVKFIGDTSIDSDFGNLRYKFKASLALTKTDDIILWLTGYRYIRIKIEAKQRKIWIKSHELKISRAQLNNTYQNIVEAIEMDDENIMLCCSKGSYLKFNHKKEKIVNITNLAQSKSNGKWINKMNNKEWRMIRGLISPKQSNYHLLCEKLSFGFARNYYKRYVPVALMKMIQTYYDGYKAEEIILFIAAMHWIKEIGKRDKLQNIKIISAGIYKIDGSYNEIKQSIMNYKQPEKL